EIEINTDSTIYTHLLDSSLKAVPGLNQTLHPYRLYDPDGPKRERERNNPVNTVDPSTLEPRIALVIGNANYESLSPLKTPLHDADDVAQALRDLRFDVTELRDATRQKILEGLDTFDARLQQAKVGLFYYSGHGVQYKGLNYLIPIQIRTMQPA